jgi:putative flavoprotein involved in K+ transport
VLVVGVGNSGADISLEVARTHKTWLSGKESGSIPWPIDNFFGRHVLVRFVRFLGHNILNIDTPIGRKARPNLLERTTPLIRVKPQDLLNAGIQRVPKVVDVRNGLPLLADNTTLDVKNVIWCTGYTPGFHWIDLPIFDENGNPYHERGVVHRVPGMYFVGLHFQYAMTSATVTGIGRDAEYIVKAIEKRLATRKKEATPGVLAANAA